MIVQVDSRVDYDYDISNLVYLIVKKLIFGIAIVLLFLFDYLICLDINLIHIGGQIP